MDDLDSPDFWDPDGGTWDPIRWPKIGVDDVAIGVMGIAAVGLMVYLVRAAL